MDNVRRHLSFMVVVSLLGALMLSGCSGSRSGESVSVQPAPAGVPSGAGPVASPAAPSAGTAAPQKDSVQGAAVGSSAGARSLGADRLVVRSGNVRLEVKKTADAIAALRRLASRYGAVISALELSSDTGGTHPEPQPLAGGTSSRTVPSGLPFSGSATVLVPVARFDAFRSDAEKLGRIVSERAGDEDVTQQHADLKARLQNAKAEEARLRSFFDRARSVTDMLSIERELTRVRGDIESMTAQLAVLERQAAMATLTVELVEPQAIVRPSNGIDWGFGDALTSGIQNMVDLFKFGLIFVIASSPLWVLGLAAFFFIRWRIRVGEARKAARAAAGEP